MKQWKKIDESWIQIEEAKSPDYNKLQQIRKDLTKISSNAASLTKSSDKNIAALAKNAEAKIDEVRQSIFNYNE
jgi:hypothetical protein